MSPSHIYLKRCIAGAAGCLWRAQIRTCGASCLPAIEAGWHNCLGARGHDIFLLSAPQTASGLLSLPRSTQSKNVSQRLPCPSFSFLLLDYVLGKWFQSPKFNIDTKCCVKCLQTPFSPLCKKLSNARDYFEGNGTPTCLKQMLKHTRDGKFWSDVERDDARKADTLVLFDLETANESKNIWYIITTHKIKVSRN